MPLLYSMYSMKLNNPDRFRFRSQEEGQTAQRQGHSYVTSLFNVRFLFDLGTSFECITSFASFRHCVSLINVINLDILKKRRRIYLEQSQVCSSSCSFSLSLQPLFASRPQPWHMWLGPEWFLRDHYWTIVTNKREMSLHSVSWETRVRDRGGGIRGKLFN